MKRWALYSLLLGISLFLLSCTEKKEENLYNSDDLTEGAAETPGFSMPGGIYQEEIVVEITSDTEEAKIYYTTDKTDPDESSTEYVEPLTISLETVLTLKARAYKKGKDPSSVATATYTVTGKLGLPEFSIDPGVYTEPKSISLSHYDAEAVIRYTTDGSEPNAKSKIYSTAISITGDTSTEIKAKAFKDKWSESDTLSGLFVITGTLTVPVFLTEPGIYTEEQSIAIESDNADAEIRYEVYDEDGGDDPTENSTLYTQPFLVPLDTIVVVKAAAFQDGWISSPVISGKFIITGTVENPVFSPIEGTYTSEQSVTISIPTPGAVIRYTIDSSEPTELSPLHSSPITVPLNTKILIKAKGFKKDWTSSSTIGGNYNVTGKVVTPVFSVMPNYYTSAQSVVLSTTTAGASIKFTIDGSVPSKTHGLEYTSPIAVASTTTLKAFAYKQDWIDSDPIEGTYNITGNIQAPVFSPEEGNYTSAQVVTLSSNVPGTTIKYTIDGSSPTRNTGLIYSDPFTVSQTRTVKAIAFRADWEGTSDSTVSSATYTITGRVVNPKFSVEPDNYTTTKNVAISTETAGAVIRYTTNGTDPTRTEGDLYSTAITIDKTTTLKAIAYKPEWEGSSNSDIASGLYTITGKVFAPDIAPLAQNHTQEVEVQITSITEGATIRYTIDGTTNPTRFIGELYGAPFTLTAGATVKAIAYKTDWEESSNSDITSRAYTITGKVESPKLSVEPGNYTTAVTLTLSCDTVGAKMRYTIDGTTPTRTSTLYSAAISIPSTRTIKVIAYKDEWQTSSDSDIVSGLYTITGKVSTPVMTPDAGNFTDSASVTITTDTVGAVIRYTTNGMPPSRSTGTIYTAPVQVNSTTTLKAIAYKDSWQVTSDSDIASGVYTITGKVANPVIAPQTGFYMSQQTVSISCSTSGSKIKYTTNGTPPSRINGSLYSGSFTVSSTSEIKAIAYKEEWQESSNSDIVSETLTITGKVIAPTFNPVGGKYTEAKSISISSATSDIIGDVVIRYTLDGSTPSRASTLYEGPVLISSNKTLKAVAYVPQWENASDSNVTSSDYVITGVVPAPAISPNGGSGVNSISITLSSVAGSIIKYTIDETNPSRTNGLTYSGIINLTQSSTLKAMAYVSDWESSSDSSISSASFTVSGNVQPPVFSPLPLANPTSDPVYISITPTTVGSTVRYTTDGTNPSETHGTVYTGSTINITQPTTLKAIAYKIDWVTSGIVSSVYKMSVVQPLFSPLGGTYNTNQNVIITTVTPETTIYYTTDGSTPTTASDQYTSPVLISSNSTLNAVAYKNSGGDWLPSSMTAQVYTMKVGTPTFSVPSGIYIKNQLVELETMTPNSEIRYDYSTGTGVHCNPIKEGETIKIYDPYAPIEVLETATLKAIACKADWNNSSITDNYIEIKVAAPVFDYPTGDYTFPQTITMSTETVGAHIRYTVDGTEPATFSTIYNPTIDPIIINGPTVIKARAFKGSLTHSEISTEVYFGTDTPVNNLLVLSPEGNIQQAINSSPVPSTILIPAGTYSQTVIMKEGVSLKGVDSSSVIIEGANSNGIGIIFPTEIKSTTFIENITIKGAGNSLKTYGVQIWEDSSPTIKNCIILGGNGTDETFAIYNNGLTPQIYNNEIDGGFGRNSYAIYSENSARPLIKENIVYGGSNPDINSESFGIYNTYSSAIILSNTINGGDSTNAIAIFNDNSANVRIFGNDINGCTNCASSYGVYNNSDSGVFVVNNIIHGGYSDDYSYGIYNKSKDMTVSNNTISGGSAIFAVSVYNNRQSSESLAIFLKNNILFTDNTDIDTFCLYEQNNNSYFSQVKNNNLYKCQILLLKAGTQSITSITGVNSYSGISDNKNYNPDFIDESGGVWKPQQQLLKNGLNLYYDHYFPINNNQEPIDKDGATRSINYPITRWWIGAYEM